MGSAEVIRRDVAGNAPKKRTALRTLHEAKQFVSWRLTANLCSAVAILATLVAGEMGTAFTILLFAVIGNVLPSVQTKRTPAPCTYAFPEIAGWFADFLMYALLALALVCIFLTRSWETAIPLLAIAGALNICAVSQLPVIAAALRLNRLGIVLADTHHLERLAIVNTVVLDETQVIKADNGQVVKLQPAPGIGFDSLLAAASSVTELWSTGITAAIRKAAKQRRVAPLKSRIELTVPGSTYQLFSPNGTLLGTMRISDPSWDSYKESIERLRRMKLDIILLSAEEQAIAQQQAATLGITTFEAELFPDDAQYKLSSMVGEGRQVAVVNGAAEASARSCMSLGEFLTLDLSLPRAIGAIRAAQTACKLIELILAIYLLVASVSVGMAMSGVLPPALAAATAYGTDWALLFCFGWFASKAVPAPKLQRTPVAL